MASHPIGKALTHLGTATAHPAAFLVFLAYAVSWVFIQPDTLDWHGAATLVTWAMTLLIQRSEHRDTQAIQAKLDELLKAVGDADSGLQRIDDEEPEEIEAVREERTSGPRSGD
jgi:low affinity Fe/Cu permease